MRNARFAGQIARYHTWPLIHKQSVAEHTYHVLRIWCQIWGPPPKQVTEYAIWHDAGEMGCGDPPYPSKQKWPELKKICDQIEREQLTLYGVAELQLFSHEKQRFKICDLLDMFELGMVEVQMGNSYAEPIVDDVIDNVVKLLGDLPEEDRERVKTYVWKEWYYQLPSFSSTFVEDSHENTQG